MPEQSVNVAPGQPPGRDGSAVPGRRVHEAPHADMEVVRAQREYAEKDPVPPSMAVTGRPPTVCWRFAPYDRARLQRLLRLLFEEGIEQEQAVIGDRHAPDKRMGGATQNRADGHPPSQRSTPGPP